MHIEIINSFNYFTVITHVYFYLYNKVINIFQLVNLVIDNLLKVY